MKKPADWKRRLACSRAYYRSLLSDPEAAELACRSDFALFRSELATCSGRVLDVGGGNGLVREFLPQASAYVSLDPDLAWLDAGWQGLAPWFPCLAQPLAFVRACGEAIPCADQAFDVVLALFSINHCARPGRVIEEAGRVLRPGGRMILVLEDVEPSWSDIWSGSYSDWRGWDARRLTIEKLKALVCGWPMEPDHTRITRRQLQGWTHAAFIVRRRSWRASYFLYDLERTPWVS